MLTLLGIGTVAALLVLILFRITSVLVALTLVPLAAALHEPGQAFRLKAEATRTPARFRTRSG